MNRENQSDEILGDILKAAAKILKPKMGATMDTKTLVVGQDVYMLKPPYPFWFCIDEGKVVKVTPEGVDVQVVDRQTADAAYCQRKDRIGRASCRERV